MTPIDVSKIPADVMETALNETARIGSVDHDSEDMDALNMWQRDTANIIALAILTERAACAQHAFAMRWAPPAGMAGTKDADEISKLTTSWSHQVGMGILNRSDA